MQLMVIPDSVRTGIGKLGVKVLFAKLEVL